MSLVDLIPTMRQDAQLVLDAANLISACAAVLADVLLLGGSKSARYLKDALDALQTVIPHAQRVRLRGLGHLAADNDGRPDRVAHALANFFANRH